MHFSRFIWETWRTSPGGVTAIAAWRRRGAGLREVFVDAPPHPLFGPFELRADDPSGEDRADRVQEAVIADVREAAVSFDWILGAANISGQSAVDNDEDARRVYEETLREGILVNWHEDDNKYVIGGVDGDGARIWTAEIEAISLGFWAAHPEHFVPFRFHRSFDVFRQIAGEFEIALPEPPGEKSWFERALYYLTLNTALLEFGRRFGMNTVELCAFLHDFAPSHISSEVDSELPPARTVWWLHGGTNNNGDFEFLERATKETTSPWQGNENARRGDIAVVYCLAPHSIVHSLWRVVGDGFYDPFSYFSRVVTIGRPTTGLPKISSAELAADPVWQQWPATRAHFQGASGRELPRECYAALVEKLVVRGFDRAAVPLIEAAPLRAGLVVEDENDVEEKLIVPFLERLGYAPSDWRRRLPVRFGRGERIYPDFAVGMREDETGPRCRLIVEAKFRLASRAAVVRDFRQAQSYALQLRAGAIVLAAREGVWLWERTRETFIFDEHTHWSWNELDAPALVAKVALRIGQGQPPRRSNERKKR